MNLKSHFSIYGKSNMNLVIIVISIFIFHVNIHSVRAQQQCRGTETFDKLTGYTLRNAAQIPLFSSVGNTVTAECNNRCRASSDCPGFLINYENESCFRVDFNSLDLDRQRDVIPSTPTRINYFEKVCFDGVIDGKLAPACEKAWIYERVPGFELAGYDDRVEKAILTRKECQELCLRDKDLPCRSAEYDYTTFTCRLSKETRRSQPAAYRATTEDVDYLENQCSDVGSLGMCEYQEYPGQDLGFPDLQITARNKGECQQRCDETTAFVCRSLSYFPSTSSCRLSGDDNLSTGPTALGPRRGANYYQKAPCVDLSLVCTSTSMTITLNTEEGFEGKMFALKNPRGCKKRGTGETETRLTFLYEDPDNRCGVEREERGVFSNTIVIQNHPIIQQKGDRAIKLYCFFSAGEKTVTNSYDVIADTIRPGDDDVLADDTTATGIPTSIVNATAPEPSVILRIVDENGDDISGTRLGQALYIRIEIVGDTIFDIFARNLVAKSGLEDEEIKLLDDRGCPTDPVFPGLQKDPQTGALLGRFEAFKFRDTTVGNFEVNVQFCQDKCNPVTCGDGVFSYGKRKKRQTSESLFKTGRSSRMMYDPNLGQEVIVYNTPLRKQIFVDPGVTVNRFTADPDEINTAGGGTSGPGIFVKGEFEEGDVVCTTWTMVIIAIGCVIFLVASILVVCVLCIHSHRKRKGQEETYEHTSSRFSTATPSYGRPSTPQSPIYHTQSHLNHRSCLNTADYARHSSEQTLKSLRTSLRD